MTRFVLDVIITNAQLIIKWGIFMGSDLHTGHRERFRQRFIKTDGIGFHEHEIFELLLFYTIPRANTNETAHRIINKAGNFCDAFDLSIEELCEIKGISDVTATFFKFITDLAKNYTNFPNQTLFFKSFEDIEEYFFDFFKSYDSDTYLIMNITHNFGLLNTIRFSVNEVYSKDSKEIAAEILKRNPSNIIIGVYHPSMLAVPTQSDYRFCKKFSDIFKSLEIPFHDIIICSKTGTFSMKKKGAFSF